MSIKFTLFGAKSTGKTTYIGALKYSNCILKPETETIDYVEDNSLNSNGESVRYPNPTPRGEIKKLRFTFQKDKNAETDFELSDYDGSFAEKLNVIEDVDKSFIEYIEDSKGIIFFFPYYTKDELKTSQSKIDTINKQLDVLIRKISGDKKTRKVKPVVIAVTMWDKHSNYQNNSEENAEKYVEKIYANHYKKIERNFETLKIIPISSIENFNIEEPIKFLIEEVYTVWEVYIKEKLEKETTIGEKRKLYRFIRKREEYFKLYKDEIYIEQMNKLKEELDIYRKKIFIIGLTVVFLFGLLSYFFIRYDEKMEERQLYEKIVSKNEQHNYKGIYEDIDTYLENYKNINQNHYKKILNIKSDYSSSCKKDVKEKFENIYNLKNLEKRYDKLKFLEEDAYVCRLSSLKEEINLKKIDIETLHREYKKSKKILDNFSMETMDEDEMVYIVQTIGKLEGYNEKLTILNKFLVVVDRIGASDKENIISMILDRTSSLKIPEILLSKLKGNLNNLRKEQVYAEIIKDIQNSNFEHAIIDIESIAKGEFTKPQEDHIKILLDKKYNISVEELLKNMPNSVLDINDYHRLEEAFENIKLLKANGELKNILYKPSIGNENKNILDKKNNLLAKTMGLLKHGVKPKHITFTAYNENNSLNFSCDSTFDSTDDLRLIIGSYKYKENSGTCNRTSMTYLNSYYYRPGHYYAHALEVDTIFDDRYDFRFKLSPNDVLSIAQGKKIIKYIRNGYRISFQ